MYNVHVSSEIGHLKAVIVHTPGPEVEKMTPENAERALYSDILNLSVATEEYRHFKTVLGRKCNTFEVKDLLCEILADSTVKHQLVSNLCREEGAPRLANYLLSFEGAELARQLIEGVEMRRDNLTKFLSNERYSLRPLHNFFFTRDASISLYGDVLIGKMASPIRYRESVIMEAIFNHHPSFRGQLYNPAHENGSETLQEIRIEGGDVLVAREDVLIIGTGSRTSTQGIDYLIEILRKKRDRVFHLLVQELPEKPESFIQLDMVFTLLDHHYCMVYEPLIKGHSRFRTIHITMENGQVASIRTVPGLLEALASLGFELTPLRCGGSDLWQQEREQWHSGANFLALSPGVVVGYERNVHTLEELDRHGFRIVRSGDIIDGREPFPTEKCVIALPGSELARGGGGARCMSMPIRRSKLDG